MCGCIIGAVLSYILRWIAVSLVSQLIVVYNPAGRRASHHYFVKAPIVTVSMVCGSVVFSMA